MWDFQSSWQLKQASAAMSLHIMFVDHIVLCSVQTFDFQKHLTFCDVLNIVDVNSADLYLCQIYVKNTRIICDG